MVRTPRILLILALAVYLPAQAQEDIKPVDSAKVLEAVEAVKANAANPDSVQLVDSEGNNIPYNVGVDLIQQLSKSGQLMPLVAGSAPGRGGFDIREYPPTLSDDKKQLTVTLVQPSTQFIKVCAGEDTELGTAYYEASKEVGEGSNGFEELAKGNQAQMKLIADYLPHFRNMTGRGDVLPALRFRPLAQHPQFGLVDADSSEPIEGWTVPDDPANAEGFEPVPPLRNEFGQLGYFVPTSARYSFSNEELITYVGVDRQGRPSLLAFAPAMSIAYDKDLLDAFFEELEVFRPEIAEQLKAFYLGPNGNDGFFAAQNKYAASIKQLGEVYPKYSQTCEKEQLNHISARYIQQTMIRTDGEAFELSEIEVDTSEGPKKVLNIEELQNDQDKLKPISGITWTQETVVRLTPPTAEGEQIEQEVLIENFKGPVTEMTIEDAEAEATPAE